MKNSKADSSALSTILMISIVLLLVAGTYTWGSGLIQKQEEYTNANYIESKLLQLNTNIEIVAHEGANSSRSLRVDVGGGTLYVNNGAHCSGSSVEKNGIAYEFFTKDEVISTESASWFLIDPHENNMECSANYSDHSGGLLLAKADHDQSLYKNELMTWYRQLNTTGDNYLINITPGSSTLISGTSALVTVKNSGTVHDAAAGLYYTNVEINMQ